MPDVETAAEGRSKLCACGCGTPLKNPHSTWAHGHYRIVNPLVRKGSTYEVSPEQKAVLRERLDRLRHEGIQIDEYARSQGWAKSPQPDERHAGRMKMAWSASQKVTARKALGLEIYDQLAERAKKEDPSTACRKADLLDGIPLTDLKPAQIKQYRRKAQTDLWWFSTEVWGLPLVPRVHREMVDLFPARDPDVPFPHQSEGKRRLLVASRNSFKSSLSVCAIAQLILCAPDIRILLLRGTRNLAKQQLAEIKNAFVRNPKMKLLFPEFCADKKKQLGGAEEFLCPARQHERREPTISISTPESEMTGLHVDYIAVDDIVNPSSVNTPDQIQKALAAYHALTPILEPWGELTVLNTPYVVGDLTYVIRQSHEDAGAKSPWRIVWRGAWTQKPNTPPNSANPADYDLWYPERLSWDTLQQIKREMEATGHGAIFRAQYLCEFSSASETAKIDENVLLLRTVPATQLPARDPSRTFIFWDLAYASSGPNADYTVALVGQFDTAGRLYVIDCVHEHLGPFELAGRIVELAGRWEPVAVGIEDSLGAKFLLPQIQQMAAASGTRIDNLVWITPSRKKGAKMERILGLEAFVKGNRLLFSAGLPNLKELYRQLSKPGVGHDDMSDALAYLMTFQDRVYSSNDLWERITQQEAPAQSDVLETASPLGYGW